MLISPLCSVFWDPVRPPPTSSALPPYGCVGLSPECRTPRSRPPRTSTRRHHQRHRHRRRHRCPPPRSYRPRPGQPHSSSWPQSRHPLRRKTSQGRRKSLISGLWDMHSHHQLTGAGALDLFVAKGVVGTSDMGGDADFILPLRDRINTGALQGPEIIASGLILDNAFVDFGLRHRVRNSEEARQAVTDKPRPWSPFNPFRMSFPARRSLTRSTPVTASWNSHAATWSSPGSLRPYWRNSAGPARSPCRQFTICRILEIAFSPVPTA